MIDKKDSPSAKNAKFVLLLGPSGVGKSAVITEIERIDPRYSSIVSFTDRPKRPGEKKISVPSSDFSSFQEAGYFVSVNELYGYRYGVPGDAVESLLDSGRIPILDFPLNRVQDMQRFADRLIKVYVLPPSLDSLRQRLSLDGRALNNTRYEEGVEEIASLARSRFAHPDIDALVINSQLDRTARRVISLVDTL